MLKLYYYFKFWMRDIAIVRSELGTILGFTNEIGWVTLGLITIGVHLSLFGVLYFFIWFLIVIGLVGRFLRKKKIPELNNTLQNEMNKELVEILTRVKAIEEKIK